MDEKLIETIKLLIEDNTIDDLNRSLIYKKGETLGYSKEQCDAYIDAIIKKNIPKKRNFTKKEIVKVTPAKLDKYRQLNEEYEAVNNKRNQVEEKIEELYETLIYKKRLLKDLDRKINEVFKEQDIHLTNIRDKFIDIIALFNRYLRTKKNTELIIQNNYYPYEVMEIKDYDFMKEIKHFSEIKDSKEVLKQFIADSKYSVDQLIKKKIITYRLLQLIGGLFFLLKIIDIIKNDSGPFDGNTWMLLVVAGIFFAIAQFISEGINSNILKYTKDDVQHFFIKSTKEVDFKSLDEILELYCLIDKHKKEY